jgi:hypothetical protein
MPIRPRSGSSSVVRHRKSCNSSVALGCLKLATRQPCGLTPDLTCRIAPSLPAGSYSDHDAIRKLDHARMTFFSE